MSEWQPIETAPKDGAEILAFWRNTDAQVNGGEPSPIFYVCWWRDYPLGGGEWCVAGYDHMLEIAPTHWTPIPAPPDEPCFTLTDKGREAYERAVQSGAKLNGEVKAGEGEDASGN